MSPDDVRVRYLRAAGWSGADLEVERARLQRAIQRTEPALAGLIEWLEREVALCLGDHGDAYGGAR